jgi:hypothetical protein
MNAESLSQSNEVLRLPARTNGNHDMSTPIKTTYRKELVQFLFSLCVANIAVFAAALATIDPLWDLKKLACISHLTLALVVIWTSWFGWRQSVERDSADESHILSKGALLTLLDLSLVILYFILVRSADLMDVGQSKQGSLQAHLESPTPHPEARVLLSIYMVYLAWDLMSKWGNHVLPWKNRGTETNDLTANIKWKWPYPSFICVVLAGLLVLFGTSRVHKSGNVWASVFFDLALISIMLFFRFAKDYQRLKIELKDKTNIDISSDSELKKRSSRCAVVAILYVIVFAIWGGNAQNLFPNWTIP